MASAPQSLPLFYNSLEPLSSEQHGNFRIRPSDGAPFLANQHAIPLTVDEFPMAQRDMPIVFSQGDDGVPLALMGLNEGINVFVDEAGKLLGRCYVPAYIRRYPWLLAKLRPDSEELSLCFDPTSNGVGEFEEGEALLQADGQPTEVTKSILNFCEEFEQAAARTGQFMNDLKDMDLLMEGEVAIQVPGNEQPFIYRGFQMVNEQKLRDLRGDQQRKLAQNGMLPLLHAHLFSLQLVRDIFQMQVEQGKGPIVPAPQQPVVANA
jgi:hypothetical protein